MKKIIKIFPLFIVELLAKKYAPIDTMEDGSQLYRISDSNKKLNGAGILIRKTNQNGKK